MANGNGNGLSWKLMLILISVFVAVIGYNFGCDLSAFRVLDAKIQCVDKEKVSKERHTTDYARLERWMISINEKIDTLILKSP